MSTDQMMLDDRFPWEEEDAAPPSSAQPAGGAAPPAAGEIAPGVEDAGAIAEAGVFAPVVEDAGTIAELAAFAPAADSDAVAQDSTAPAPSRPVAAKEYYSISEVCDIVGLKPHVLRYWETQFQVLNPSKNRSGNRVYQRKEIKLILLVKHLLYEEKFTVEGAKAKLDQMRRGGRLQEATARKLDRQMIELLRSELELLRKILTVPSAG